MSEAEHLAEVERRTKAYVDSLPEQEGLEGSNYMHPNALLPDVFIDIDFLEHPE